MNPRDEDPERLLDDEAQWCEPWGGSEDGAPCDKCEGAGCAEYECWSCLLTGARQSCPACAGRIRWVDDCPVCRGTGTVDGSPRRGVSVFPTTEGLYHYLLSTEAELDGLLVELRAGRAPDVDFDADQGALLVIPTAVIRSEPLDRGGVERIRASTQEIAGR